MAPWLHKLENDFPSTAERSLARSFGVFLKRTHAKFVTFLFPAFARRVKASGDYSMTRVLCAVALAFCFTALSYAADPPAADEKHDQDGRATNELKKSIETRAAYLREALNSADSKIRLAAFAEIRGYIASDSREKFSTIEANKKLVDLYLGAEHFESHGTWYADAKADKKDIEAKSAAFLKVVSDHFAAKEKAEREKLAKVEEDKARNDRELPCGEAIGKHPEFAALFGSQGRDRAPAYVAALLSTPEGEQKFFSGLKTMTAETMRKCDLPEMTASATLRTLLKELPKFLPANASEAAKKEAAALVGWGTYVLPIKQPALRKALANRLELMARLV